MNNIKIIRTKNSSYIYNPDTKTIERENNASQRSNVILQPNYEDYQKELCHVDQMLQDLQQNQYDSRFYFVYTLSYQCNFRCKYCIYSGGYEHQRHHENLHISDEIVDLSLQFINKAIENIQEPFICFYDESLIRFETIKNIINMIKEIGYTHSKNIRFVVTTNGLILQNEVIRNFLIENNCILYVSLDGPQKIHDQWRETINGEPTWLKIMTVMKEIKETNPEYYYNNIIFQSVIVDQEDLLSINKFFNESDLTKENKIIGRMVSKTDMNERLQKFIPLEKPLMEIDAIDYFIKNIEKENYDQIRFLSQFWGYYLEKIHYRNTNNSIVNRICIPGKRKVFIDISGNIYNCEKHGGTINIGSLESGFNFGNINTVVKHFTSYYMDSCTNCWIKDLCDICYDGFAEGLDINKEIMHELCEREKNQWEQFLWLYLSINEVNPHYFSTERTDSYILNEAKCGF